MHNSAIIARLTHVRKHSNADRLQCATVLGNQVVVGLSAKEGDLGIYFDSNLQLSNEFAKANDLVRRKDADGKPAGGMFDENRRVKTQRFRGEVSDGFWCELSHLDFISNKPALNEGYEFTEISGVPICNKYLVEAAKDPATQGKKTKAAKTSVMFKEHYDTEHFGKKVFELRDEDELVLSEKLHGTSGRVGHVLMSRPLNWIEKLLTKLGIKIDDSVWAHLNGTRRVVLEETSGTQFHDPTIREKALAMFKGNLRKGETVYFEIVGFEPSGVAIMPSVDTSKLKDKEFSRLYANAGDGKTMIYRYGCADKECEVYIYRITSTNVDGKTLDYTWDDVVERAKELGVKSVPFISRITARELRATTSGDDRDLQDALVAYVEAAGKGASLLDSSHIREGVCVKVNRYGLAPKVYKHKSFEFKCLEGIIKDAGVVDQEDIS